MKSIVNTINAMKYLVILLLVFGQNFSNAQCNLTISSPSPTQVCPGTVVNLSGSATVYGANQSFNFNVGSLPSGWSVAGGASFSAPCGAGPDGNYFWASTAGSGVPFIQTAGFDVCSGGSILFDMRYAIQGGASPCEGPDLANEGVTLQYSLNNGATWIDIVYYSPGGYTLPTNPNTTGSVATGVTPYTSWNTFGVAIPPAAISGNTMFRWVQDNSSGTCCDNWGIDNVFINAGPCLTANINWSNGQNGVNTISPTINADQCFTADVYDNLGNFLCSSATSYCFTVFTPSIDGGPDLTICNGSSLTLTASGGSGFVWDNGVTDGVPFTPPMGVTTYTVNGTDVNGCAATDQVVITVTPGTPPTINPAGPTCVSAGLVPLSGNPSGGTFTGPGVTGTNFNPATAGIGTHTINYYYTSGGCTGSATTDIVVTSSNTIAAGTNQTVCMNSPIATISLATTSATGATFSGLPAGVTGSWAGNVATISGTPTVSGTYNYTVTTTGGCPPATTSGTITVTPLNTIAAGTNQTVCSNAPMTNITLATTGATGATFAGLPAGVTGSWAGNVATISGTPTVAGTFNYTVTTTGGCPPASTTGTITVNPGNTIAPGTNQTVCINSAIANISLATTGATGATFAGLPAGVTGSWAGNVATISGTPTVAGVFNYTVTTTGGCAAVNTTGTITVNPYNTISAGTNQTVCINSPLTAINLTTTAATGATFAGLPAGVTGSWAGNVATISGTPTVAGTFNYTVTTTGGCPPATTTGTITVTPLNTISAGVDGTTCVNSALPNITLTTTGATGATFTGLPAGVTGSWAGNVVTISGTPTVSGTFNYTVTTSGGCPPATASGTITVVLINTIAPGTNQTVCINSAITNISLATSGATGATFAGLPPGVTGSWAGNTATISGTPTAAGTYNYTITTTGGCPPAGTSGTITVNPMNTIAAGTDQTVCMNSAIADITLATTAATGATFTGLPAGVTGSWAGNVATISGTPTVSGTFNYTVTTTGGCPPATATGTITVTPLNTIAAGTSQAICVNSAITNITLATTGATGAAFTGLPAGVTGTWAGNVVTISGTPSVDGVFNYTVTTTGGCPPATATGTITVYSLPIVDFSADVLQGCEPLDVVFTNETVAGAALDVCVWNLGDGTIVNDCGPISHTYANAGYYDVSLMTTDVNGCSNSYSVPSYIYVEAYPEASFTPTNILITSMQPVVNYENTSTGATSYVWNFGDGSASSSSLNPTHTFPAETAGAYTVTLISSSPIGCADTAYGYVRVEEVLIYYLPNTFTPDGDNYNETFKPVFTDGFDPYSFSMFIYNRWGEIVWESHDTTVGWNGRYGGLPVQDGTYTWKIEFKTSMNDERIMDVGHVNLIR